MASPLRAEEYKPPHQSKTALYVVMTAGALGTSSWFILFMICVIRNSIIAVPALLGASILAAYSNRIIRNKIGELK